jgi:omega-hydroxy-beta-dihydromenaquinone-9 sulfotransferase
MSSGPDPSDVPRGALTRPMFNLSLAAWRRLRAKYPARLDAALRIRATMAAAIASAAERMQARLYGGELEAISLEAPVFIVGHWRSGTSLLHEMLALDDNFISPTTYQCFNPHSFLLRPMRREVSAVRPAGDRIVSSLTPQEEEFAMLCLGCISPYEVFIFPAGLNDLPALCSADELAAADREFWLARFTTFLKGVVRGASSRRLLLKSPSNSFRIAMLSLVFPEAKFIQIVREPTAVAISTVEMWKAMWERYALSAPPDSSATLESVMFTYLRLEQKLRRDAGNLPVGGFVTIRYEDLIADPHRTIGAIYRGLNLAESRCPIGRIDDFLKSAPPLRANREPAPAETAAMRERCGAIFERYGYLRS